ncbi:MAG: YraN family protein [Deltaproteobacteria bacterium]|nr:YraN family protein [Deltaproteobacteria bacterium]
MRAPGPPSRRREAGRPAPAPHPSARRALGIEGEARAAAWLEARGWRVLARNLRAGGVELDLVAGRGALVAFVEVKTRASRGAGTPAEAVDRRKRARLVRGAAAWLAAHGRPGLHARFDVIACERGPDGAWRLEHLEGAFDAGDS